LQEQLLAEEVFLHLITSDINAMLTMLPSHLEIRAAVFALNKEVEFFTTGWILPLEF
jgi:hypothetical protein